MKNYYLILVAFSLFVAGCKKDGTSDFQKSSPPSDIPETQPAVLKAVSENISTNAVGYYVGLPARYDSTDKKYPLLICLHGIGEIGNGTSDLAKVLNNATPRLLNQHKFPPSFTVNGKTFSFIVVAPQFKAWPTPADVQAVLTNIIKKFRVDTSRLYVSGLSMGGGVTWEYAASYAPKLAAIVPIAGASSPNSQKCKAIANANLPVWAFHNQDDGTVSVNNSINYVNGINALHPAIAAKLTLWPTGGHDSWTKASDPSFKENGMNMYEWMLQYSR